jgi:predicted lipase
MTKMLRFVFFAASLGCGADLSTQFTRSSAEFCAELSQAAYFPQTDSSVAKFGMPCVKFLKDTTTNTRGFILADSGAIVVCMKGTNDLRSALVDAAAFQIGYPYKGALCKFFEFLLFFLGKEKVHIGFIGAYATVRDNVISTVSDLLKAKKRNVFVTGHSLGAALATLAAYDIAAACRVDACLYTFGGPRVGNPLFAKNFNAKVKSAYRIKNFDDVVGCVPLEKLELKGKKLEYRHVGALEQLDTNGQIVPDEICPSKERILEEIASHSPIANHDIVNYIKQLKL